MRVARVFIFRPDLARAPSTIKRDSKWLCGKVPFECQIKGSRLKPRGRNPITAHISIASRYVHLNLSKTLAEKTVALWQ